MQQHEREFLDLLKIYLERKPSRVLEIGTYEGGTLFHWLTAGDPEVVVVVDDFTQTNRLAWPKVWATWAAEVTRLEVIAADSRSPGTFETVQEFGPFDWAFIDADHSYDAVRADWERYRPLCTGVVAFHDILPPSANHPEIQVSRLWAEIKTEGYRTVELIDDPAADWGGIGVVFLDERTRA